MWQGCTHVFTSLLVRIYILLTFSLLGVYDICSLQLFCMALRSEVVLVPMLESELAVSILTPVSSFCSPKTVSQQLHERNKANFRRRRTSQSGCVGSSSLANLHTLNNTQGIRTTTKSIVGALMRSPSAPNLASICQTMNESMVFSSAWWQLILIGLTHTIYLNTRDAEHNTIFCLLEYSSCYSKLAFRDPMHVVLLLKSIMQWCVCVYVCVDGYTSSVPDKF